MRQAEAAKREEAAVKMQAVMRGRLARNRIRTMEQRMKLWDGYAHTAKASFEYFVGLYERPHSTVKLLVEDHHVRCRYAGRALCAGRRV